MHARVSVVGAGSVGSAVAFSLLLKPVAGEILLVDPAEQLRDAQAEDLSDASLSGVRVRSGTPKEAGQSSVIVITAGAKQHPNESRPALLARNIDILKSVIESMKPFRSDTVILLIANPVDALTYFAQQLSGLPKGQVIGSGTFLDSARLRRILARDLDVDPSSVDAFVIGEHGDSQLVAWSRVTIGGIPITEALPSASATLDRAAVAAETRDMAARIIKAKGATSYGIGSIAASLCRSIILNDHKVRPVSHWNEELQCCLSLPVVLGHQGVVRELKLPLEQEEQAALEKSASFIRQMIDSAGQ